jgi:hypothetical protein
MFGIIVTSFALTQHCVSSGSRMEGFMAQLLPFTEKANR